MANKQKGFIFISFPGMVLAIYSFDKRDNGVYNKIMH